MSGIAVAEDMKPMKLGLSWNSLNDLHGKLRSLWSFHIHVALEDADLSFMVYDLFDLYVTQIISWYRDLGLVCGRLHGMTTAVLQLSWNFHADNHVESHAPRNGKRRVYGTCADLRHL